MMDQKNEEEPLRRKCNDCGNVWYDTRTAVCPRCGRIDTEIVSDYDPREYRAQEALEKAVGKKHGR